MTRQITDVLPGYSKIGGASPGSVWHRWYVEAGEILAVCHPNTFRLDGPRLDPDHFQSNTLGRRCGLCTRIVDGLDPFDDKRGRPDCVPSPGSGARRRSHHQRILLGILRTAGEATTHQLRRTTGRTAKAVRESLQGLEARGMVQSRQVTSPYGGYELLWRIPEAST